MAAGALALWPGIDTRWLSPKAAICADNAGRRLPSPSKVSPTSSGRWAIAAISRSQRFCGSNRPTPRIRRSASKGWSGTPPGSAAGGLGMTATDIPVASCAARAVAGVIATSVSRNRPCSASHCRWPQASQAE